MDRVYDVVVYGASGFTGRFIVHELLSVANGGLSIAVAGRSAARVKETLLGHSPALRAAIEEYCRRNKFDFLPVLECESSDSASLLRMASSARVVIAAAGPFNAVGMPVVDACVRAGTHYVDITGEPLFVERVFSAHHQAALRSGLTLVTCCGFDCVPSDMAVDAILRRVPSVSRIEGFLTVSSSANLGTLFTAVEGIRSAPQLAAVRRKADRPKLEGASKFRPRGIFYDSRAGLCLLFPGADPTILRNSQIERQQRSKQAPVELGLYFGLRNPLVFLALIWIGLVIVLASKLGFFERLLRRYPRALTLGLFEDQPSVEALKNGFAQWDFFIRTSQGRSLTAVMRVADPGYNATSVCVVGCALMLVRDAKTKKIPVGVVTPATAFGETELLQHLVSRGCKFEINESKK